MSSTTLPVIVCFGPGPKFKGGISNYNTSLARALDRRGDCEVHIVSWTQQYPAIVPREFVDKTSKTDFLTGTNIRVHYITNYNRPSTWAATARLIAGLRPSKVIFQWAIALQGLPLGFIARRLLKRGTMEVLFDLHFVIQKEQSSLDRRFTRYGIGAASGYIVHARQTADELQQLFSTRQFQLTESGDTVVGKGMPVIKLFHPIYDLFQPDLSFDKQAFKAEHGLKEHVFLFFGFIRKYKGLHHVIPAFHLLSQQRNDVSLIIAGESFWNTLDKKKLSTRIKNAVFGTLKKWVLRSQDDERNYQPLALIEELGLQDKVLLKNEFIGNEAVAQYFQAADALLLFYLYATPSGVESIGYNFQIPVIATKVGHFPETVRDGFNGYLAEAEDIASMAAQMQRFIEHPIPRANVGSSAAYMSWERYAEAVMKSRPS